MKIQRTIYWEKLAEIYELEEYFEEDFQGFQKLIEANIEEVETFSEQTLDKFAKLRVLEITNGCTQWAFRRGDKESLSVEQTRECMNLVMGFMKQGELYFPSEGKIELDQDEKEFQKAGRSLYQSAFKKNIEESQRKYHAASTAQFIVYGQERIQKALSLVKQDYESLFSAYYIERGRKYIAPYLKGFE